MARAPGGRGSVRVLEHARLVRPLRARTWRPAQREAVDNLSGYVDMGKEPAGLFFRAGRDRRGGAGEPAIERVPF